MKLSPVALAIAVTSSISYSSSNLNYGDFHPTEYHKRFSGHYPTNRRVGSHFDARKKKGKRKKR